MPLMALDRPPTIGAPSFGEAGRLLVIAVEPRMAERTLRAAAPRIAAAQRCPALLAACRRPWWWALGSAGTAAVPLLSDRDVVLVGRATLAQTVGAMPQLDGLELLCTSGPLDRALDQLLSGGCFSAVLVGGSRRRRAADRLCRRAEHHGVAAQRLVFAAAGE
jgi:hypothetical protein